MNPYYYDPRKFATVDQAKYVLKLFDAEIKTNVAAQSEALNRVQAQMDVLKQTHPDLADSLDSITYSSLLVGEIEGQRAALDRMKMQFVMSLPFQLRKALEAEPK